MKKFIVTFLMLLPLLVFAQPTIPGYTLLGSYGGHAYYLSQSGSDWATAQANCVSNGGYLACITTAGEEAFLESVLINNEVWIGASAPQAGSFTWVSGEPWSYTHWLSGWPQVTATLNGLVLATDIPPMGWGDTYATYSPAQWILEVGAVVLPVEMTSFTATPANESVTLNWRTETETENSHFNIFRSTSREDRGELVARVAGHGTTSNANTYRYTDNQLLNGSTYYYRIADVALDGTEHMNSFVVSATPRAQAGSSIPTEFSLEQNFPNPFNPSTSISYGIAKAGFVSLKVFNSMGQEVATLVNGIQAANSYKVEFNAANLPSGVYYYKLQTEGQTFTKMMTLSK